MMLKGLFLNLRGIVIRRSINWPIVLRFVHHAKIFCILLFPVFCSWCEEFSLSYLRWWRDEERLRNSPMSQLHFTLASVSLRQVIALMRVGGGRPKFTPCQYLSNYNCKLCVVSNCHFSWRFDKYAFACRLGILFQINWMVCTILIFLSLPIIWAKMI